MKLFWRILAFIYSIFRGAGLNLKPYFFLFNRSKIRFPKTIIKTIHADIIFNSRERELILEAVEDIFRFTNKRIKFEVTFDLTFDDEELFINSCVILKAHSSHDHIQKSDKYYENNIIGLCYFRNNNTKSIYLVTDRLEHSDNLFRTTAIHEFGHYLGMTHTKNCSIMQPINSDFISYPTYIDAVELARIWKCLPSDLGYFKL